MWTETWNYTDINGQEGNSFFSFWFFKLSNIERSTMRTFSGFQVFPGISSPLKYVTRWLDYECLSRLFSLLVFAQQKRRIILWWCVYCVKFWCRSTSPRSLSTCKCQGMFIHWSYTVQYVTLKNINKRAFCNLWYNYVGLRTAQKCCYFWNGNASVYLGYSRVYLLKMETYSSVTRKPSKFDRLLFCCVF